MDECTTTAAQICRDLTLTGQQILDSLAETGDLPDPDGLEDDVGRTALIKLRLADHVASPNGNQVFRIRDRSQVLISPEGAISHETETAALRACGVLAAHPVFPRPFYLLLVEHYNITRSHGNGNLVAFLATLPPPVRDIIENSTPGRDGDVFVCTMCHDGSQLRVNDSEYRCVVRRH